MSKTNLKPKKKHKRLLKIQIKTRKHSLVIKLVKMC